MIVVSAAFPPVDAPDRTKSAPSRARLGVRPEQSNCSGRVLGSRLGTQGHGYRQAALEDAQCEIRGESLDVRIIRHQPGHESIVSLRVRDGDQDDEIGFTRYVKRLLHVVMPLEPCAQRVQHVRPLAFNLQRRDEGDRAADALGIDDGGLADDDARFPQPFQSALHRRGREADVFRQTLGSLTSVPLDQIQQPAIEFIKFHASPLDGRPRAENARIRLPNRGIPSRRESSIPVQEALRNMKLLYQTHSPFARKVLVFAYEADIAGRIQVIHQETSPTRRNDLVFAENPLGKVPVLLRPGGPPLFDSDVICGYLDTLHDGRQLIPAAGEARWLALRDQALAQGLADAGIAIRWESVRRPEALRYGQLRDGYITKLMAGYDWLEDELDVAAPVHVGHIALATCLAWLEFRGLPGFRERRPRLSDWFDGFQERPSMQATPLSGETHD